MSHLDEVFADLPAFLSVADVAQLLSMSESGVYKWIRAKQLHAYKVGTVWRIAKADLRATLERGSSDLVEPDEGDDSGS